MPYTFGGGNIGTQGICPWRDLLVRSDALGRGCLGNAVFTGLPSTPLHKGPLAFLPRGISSFFNPFPLSSVFPIGWQMWRYQCSPGGRGRPTVGWPGEGDACGIPAQACRCHSCASSSPVFTPLPWRERPAVPSAPPGEGDQVKGPPGSIPAQARRCHSCVTRNPGVFCHPNSPLTRPAAQAGLSRKGERRECWIPASTGMTHRGLPHG